jgi:hypothetical protein
MMFLNVLTKMKKKNILLTALLAVLCSASSIQAAEAANPIQSIEIGSTGQLQRLSQLTINNGKKILNEWRKGLTVAASWLLPKMLNIPYYTMYFSYDLLPNIYINFGFWETLLSTTLSFNFLVDTVFQVLKQPNNRIRRIIPVAFLAFKKCIPLNGGFKLVADLCFFGDEIYFNGIWNTFKIMFCLPLFLEGVKKLQRHR